MKSGTSRISICPKNPPGQTGGRLAIDLVGGSPVRVFARETEQLVPARCVRTSTAVKLRDVLDKTGAKASAAVPVAGHAGWWRPGRAQISGLWRLGDGLPLATAAGIITLPAR